MKILVVGSGGREHALLWKLAADGGGRAQLFVTGGNGGTGLLAESVAVAPTDVGGIAAWAQGEGVDLVVVGPEVPLAAGLVNALAERGIAAFGPTREAAQIESSKAYAKGLMSRHRIPTAAHRTFSNAAAALDYVAGAELPIVVKESGLAGGKGVVVAESHQAASDAVRAIFVDTPEGSHREVVVEEFMDGEELSVLALCDGVRAVPLVPAQDHKRLGDGDTGPNTGGMGCYAPVTPATAPLLQRVQRDILEPTLAALAAEGRPFRGLLYAGLMLTADGPRVVEFNCRFGDPETQVIVPLLAGSLLEPLQAVASGGDLAGYVAEWRSGAAVATVLAAPGYPGEYPTGAEIRIAPELRDADDLLCFHAGTRLNGERLVTAGGRVLATVGLGATVAQAAERSRWAAERIDFEGRTFRRDIAHREIARARS